MQKKKFTLVELLVVITAIAILATMLFPLFGKMRRKANQVESLNLCRQHSMELVHYFSDVRHRTLPSLTSISSYGDAGNSEWVDTAGGGVFGYPIDFLTEDDAPSSDGVAFFGAQQQGMAFASVNVFVLIAAKGDNNGKKPDEDDHENPGGNYDNRDKNKDKNSSDPEDGNPEDGNSEDGSPEDGNSEDESGGSSSRYYDIYDSEVQTTNSTGISADGVNPAESLNWETYNNDEKAVLTTERIWEATHCMKPVAYGDGHVSHSGME